MSKKAKHHHNDPEMIFFARDLRTNLTNAERILWYHLRSRRFQSFKFRRQHPIGVYIVDFVCILKKLVIELDGGQHAEQASQDKIRDSYLRGLSSRILRFWNYDIFTDLEGVMERIYRACK